MTEGFKKTYHRDRPALLALMQHSTSAFCVWWFMYNRSDRNDIFSLKEEFIIEDTGLSVNVVRRAKRLLREYDWITLTGVRAQTGCWDTNEYKVQIGRAPTEAPKVCSGQRVEKSAIRGAESVLPTGAQKVCRTVDIQSLDAPRGGERVGTSVESRAGGVGGIPPRFTERSEGRGEAADNHAGDANAIAAARASASASPFEVLADARKSNPKPTPMGGAAPQTPRCGDMGDSGSETQEPESVREMSDAEYLATYLWYMLRGRQSLGQNITILPKWEQYWSTDFQTLLDSGVERADIELAIWASQWPANQKYYIRGAKVVENFALLLEKGQKHEHLKRHHQCPGCHSMFSLGIQLSEHAAVCQLYPAASQPARDDAAEEESWLAVEDFLTQEGGGLGYEGDYDPFAGERIMELVDDDGNTVYEELEPGRMMPVMIPEDWGRHDFDFVLPKPFKEPAKGRIRPFGETEDKRDWVRRAEMWGHAQDHADNGNGGEEPPSQDSQSAGAV